ncbi:MAG: SDR family oxidoreductase [Bdellovibrionaceae bacterium]|nr:SDR family oxidoreductase [Pseudobdellovibrionaceae bacterium]
MDQKKSVIITGAGSGIGRATAQVFAQHNYHCILVGRNQKNLQQTQKLAPNSDIICFDFNELDNIADFFFQQLGPFKEQIHVLVNNAGVFQKGPVFETDLSIWQTMLRVNLLAPVELTKVVIPWMKEKQTGAIINISSTLGLRPIPDTSAYSSSKAAMISWTASLALECGPFGIRANCVCPGLVDTPIQHFHHLPASEKARQVEAMKGLQPLQRIGAPEEIARAIYFLASEESSWTTGAVLNVDGGINI